MSQVTLSREAFKAKFAEGLEIKDLAAHFNIPQTTVRSVIKTLGLKKPRRVVVMFTEDMEATETVAPVEANDAASDYALENTSVESVNETESQELSF